MRRVPALVVVVVALLAGACASGGGDDPSVDAGGSITTAAPSTSSTGFVYGTGGCPPSTAPASTPHTFAAAPQKCIVDGVDYGAVIKTTLGDITVDLLEDKAPGTVNNFVVLARWGWFNGDDFHRVVKGFVAQGGDPFGKPQGTGGPGYAIKDELPDSVSAYLPGAVAMANSGPNTNGSQFFLCVNCSGFPKPLYSLFGQISSGMDVVMQIDALGNGDGPPSTPVGITSVTITEKKK